MSFGEGDLHKRCDDYKRQVGGLQAALNAKKREVGRLRVENEELRAEIDWQQQLEELLRAMHLTWKRLDEEGDWPESGHNGWKTFTERMAELGLEADA